MSSGKRLAGAWVAAMSAWACTLQAASIRGIVSDSETGKLLARSLVRIQPVGGTASAGSTVRTDRFGSFQFPDLKPGAYVLTASRRYFIPVQYGQKRWNSAGYPITVTDAESPFLTIQMFRYSAISGTVVDENDVGLPDQEVSAYRNTKPPQLVTSVKADERGGYRIYGMEPGNYLVRTLPQHSEEGSYLPTYAHETQSAEQAHAVDLGPNQQINRVDIRPEQGQLYTLNVRVTNSPEQPPCAEPIALTVASEWGRKTVSVVCPGFKGTNYEFTGLPRGQYEVYGSVPLTERPRVLADYVRVSVVGNTVAAVALAEVRETRFTFAGASQRDVESGEIRVLGRRKDLAGTGPVQTVALDRNNTATLGPGGWQFALAPMEKYFVSSFAGSTIGRGDRRADGWNDTTLRSFNSVRFTLSTNTASVVGVVKSGNELVAGAPVFLELVDIPPEFRVAEVTVVRQRSSRTIPFHGTGAGELPYAEHVRICDAR